MTGYELFRLFLPHKEILNRQHLRINNEPADLKAEYSVGEYEELGGWLCEQLREKPTAENLLMTGVFDVRDFFGNEERTNIKELSFLEGYLLLSLSKPKYGSEYVFKYL